MRFQQTKVWEQTEQLKNDCKTGNLLRASVKFRIWTGVGVALVDRLNPCRNHLGSPSFCTQRIPEHCRRLDLLPHSASLNPFKHAGLWLEFTLASKRQLVVVDPIPCFVTNRYNIVCTLTHWREYCSWELYWMIQLIRAINWSSPGYRHATITCNWNFKVFAFINDVWSGLSGCTRR